MPNYYWTKKIDKVQQEQAMQNCEANRIYNAKIPYDIDGGLIYNIRIDTLLESIFLFIKVIEEDITYYRLHIKKFHSLTYDFELNLSPSSTYFGETDIEKENDLYHFKALVGADNTFKVYCEDLELKKIATFYSTEKNNNDGEK